MRTVFRSLVSEAVQSDGKYETVLKQDCLRFEMVLLQEFADKRGSITPSHKVS